ncbi:MAG TPA: hypothetical protein VGF15_06120 [Solirubrobacteraceae bacterium]|jgi:hypothetical protein
MSLLDKVKTQAEQTAAKAREGVQEVQAKRELNQAYANLGRTTAALAERGEISHAELAAELDHIKTLSARLDTEEAAGEQSS